jgi:glycine hydroxymethyltransferase
MIGEALKVGDPATYELCLAEERRQAESIRLIPSENYVSRAVLEASASVFTNKYSEGYPGKRYYEGQQVVDPLEQLTINRAKALFGSEHANVQRTWPSISRSSSRATRSWGWRSPWAAT